MHCLINFEIPNNYNDTAYHVIVIFVVNLESDKVLFVSEYMSTLNFHPVY